MVPMVECILLPQKFKVVEKLDFSDWRPEHAQIRPGFSSAADHAWSKAFKKMTVEKDFDLMIAKKSLFHAFRILNYGSQIAKTGKIESYGNPDVINLWEEIRDNPSKDWNCYKEKYQKPYRGQKSAFRVLCPM
jgi:hypothetical protein